MQKSLTALVAVLAVATGTDAFAADRPVVKPSTVAVKPVPFTENTSDLADIKKVRAGLIDHDRKIKAALDADPRVSALMKQITEIGNLQDRADRKKKLEALAPQIVAVRTDAIKKAGLDPKDLGAQVKALTLNRTVLSALKLQPAAPGSVISTVETSSFSKPYSYKNECPDAADTWDFDGNKVTVKASSAIADADCWTIRAGRTATVQVPPGAKKMKVVLNAKVDIDVVAVSFGAFGEAFGYVGLLVFAPSGAALSSLQVAGQSVSVPSTLIKLKTIHAANIIPDPIPVSAEGFADDLQEGDDGSTTTINLPDNVGATLEISPIVGGWVDADLQGFAKLDHDLTPKSLKVTFYR